MPQIRRAKNHRFTKSTRTVLPLRTLIVLLFLTPRLHAQLPHPLLSRPSALDVHSALVTPVDTADKASLKPVIIGGVIGAAVGLYLGELGPGSCETPGCADEYKASPYIGLVGGAIVGALAGFMLAHLPRAGPK
jgi:hypothetical protein